MQWRKYRTILQIEVPHLKIFVIVDHCIAAQMPGTEDNIKVLGVIAIGINSWRSHAHANQIRHLARDTRLLKHLTLGGMRWLLARVDDSGRQGPQAVIGATHQQHLLAMEYNHFHPGEPQHLMTYMCTQLGDEFRSCHEFIVP